MWFIILVINKYCFVLFVFKVIYLWFKDNVTITITCINIIISQVNIITYLDYIYTQCLWRIIRILYDNTFLIMKITYMFVYECVCVCMYMYVSVRACVTRLNVQILSIMWGDITSHNFLYIIAIILSYIN